MADREFVFGRADVQKLLRDHFVVAAADDWYQRRQDDPVGEFFRSVANQGPRKGQGGSTRQGRYAFTASGKLLGYNNNRDPQRILRMLRESLEEFRQLPAEERAPEAVEVPALSTEDLDDRYARTPPENGAIIKVHASVLQKDKDGNYVACGEPGENDETYRHNGFGSATDHLWMTKEEVDSLFAAARSGAEGDALPKSLAMRIARFHLVDNTRGEPPHWRRDEVRKLAIRVAPVNDGSNRAQLTGEFHFETKDGERGFVGQIEGVASRDESGKLEQFRVLALGEHWGEGPYTPNARPGKNPLAVAFKLGDPNNPEDRVPPQAIRSRDSYYEADRW